MNRRSLNLRALFALALAAPAAAQAAEIVVAGLFTDKALVQIDGGPLRTLSVGQKTAEGITLIAVDADSATFDVGGKRVRLGLGQARIAAAVPVAASVALTTDARGYFVADGQVNGKATKFIVDTGATMVTLPSSEASRLAPNYQRGQKAMISTANGLVSAFRISLDTVSVGNITLNNVDAVVVEGNSLPYALLGMTFLNRVDMKREGGVMTLTKRF